MIYVLIAIVLGFAGWQLYAFVKRAKSGKCASGCGHCSAAADCSPKK